VVLAALLALPAVLVPTASPAGAAAQGFEPAADPLTPADAPDGATTAIADAQPPEVLDPNAMPDVPTAEELAEFIGEPDALAVEIAGLEPGDEVVSLRDEYSSTYLTDEPGVLRSRVWLSPVHRLDDSGQWVPIDPSLAPDAGGGWWRARVAGGIEVGVARDSGGPMAALDLPAGRIEFDLQGAAAVPPTGWVRAETSGALIPATPGEAIDVARFSEVLPGVSVELSGTALGLKEHLILASGQAPTSFTFDLDVAGLSVRQADNGLIEFIDDSSGLVEAMIPAGYMRCVRLCRGDRAGNEPSHGVSSGF